MLCDLLNLQLRKRKNNNRLNQKSVARISNSFNTHDVIILHPSNEQYFQHLTTKKLVSYERPKIGNLSGSKSHTKVRKLGRLCDRRLSTNRHADQSTSTKRDNDPTITKMHTTQPSYENSRWLQKWHLITCTVYPTNLFNIIYLMLTSIC